MFRDRRNFPRLADPRLQGHYPGSCLKMAVELASMCLREEPRHRPDTGDIVLALDFLSSKQYVPKVPNIVKGIENDDSPKETIAILAKDAQREQAVAEAKLWGKTWRDRRRQSGQSSPEEINR